MISRIETIGDLMLWIDSLLLMWTKNKNVEKLTDKQIASLTSTMDALSDIYRRFPGPFKQCCKCHAIYPETKEWFDWCGQGRTGLSPICKFCRNAYQKKRKNQRKSKLSAADQAEIDRHRAQGDHFSPSSPKPGERW